MLNQEQQLQNTELCLPPCPAFQSINLCRAGMERLPQHFYQSVFLPEKAAWGHASERTEIVHKVALVKKSLVVSELGEGRGGLLLPAVDDAVEPEDVAENLGAQTDMFLKFLFQVAFAHAKLVEQFIDFQIPRAANHRGDGSSYQLVHRLGVIQQLDESLVEQFQFLGEAFQNQKLGSELTNHRLEGTSLQEERRAQLYHANPKKWGQPMGLEPYTEHANRLLLGDEHACLPLVRQTAQAYFFQLLRHMRRSPEVGISKIENERSRAVRETNFLEERTFGRQGPVTFDVCPQR